MSAQTELAVSVLLSEDDQSTYQNVNDIVTVQNPEVPHAENVYQGVLLLLKRLAVKWYPE